MKRGDSVEKEAPIPRPGSEAAALEAAKAHLNAGRHAEAAALFAQILERNPDQIHALIFLGVIRVAAGEVDAAEPLLTRCLDLDRDGGFAFLALRNLGSIAQHRGEDSQAIEFFEQCVARKSDFVPVFNDLGVSLQRLGRNKESIAAFDRAITLDPAHLIARHNRGRVLVDVGRVDEAIEAFRACVALAPDSVETWTLLGTAYLKVENFADAEKALRRVLTLDPESHDARLYLAEALDRTHRLKEADQMCREWAQRQGIVVTPARTARPEARVLLLGGAAMCNTPTRFLFASDRFTTITVNLLPPDDGAEDPALRVDGLPACDVVFNAIADADRGARFIEKAAALCRSIGRPVINPPEQILHARRDRLPSLLADIPGLIVPATRRRDRAGLRVLADAGEPFAVPVLVRPVGSHGGNDLRRIGDGGALGDYLRAKPFDDFYVTDYCEYRSADGYYRKYRFIFVDREVYPYHLAISKNWMVHYWRADMSEEDLKREEATYLADYRSVFPGTLAEVVRGVALQLDLDYGGMDCGLTGDGRVLVFEANANMLVHLDDSREDFAYKHAHVPKIAEAMRRLVARKLAA
jgi:tetratricopeptide (TPR) repeat protein